MAGEPVANNHDYLTKGEDQEISEGMQKVRVLAIHPSSAMYTILAIYRNDIL